MPCVCRVSSCAASHQMEDVSPIEGHAAHARHASTGRCNLSKRVNALFFMRFSLTPHSYFVNRCIAIGLKAGYSIESVTQHIPEDRYDVRKINGVRKIRSRT